MADAAREIGSALEAIHPDGGWPERADGFAAELAGADTEIREILSAIPEDRRSLVTNHRSFGYFADRYGFEVVGVVIPGGSTLADPSSAELARLVGTLREHNISAIFGETTEPVTLAEAISEELGGSVEVVRLYTGSLGEPGSGADTLIGMLLTNAELIAGALA
jgi:zinc/manganese transport system substrate-binding protein